MMLQNPLDSSIFHMRGSTTEKVSTRQQEQSQPNFKTNGRGAKIQFNSLKDIEQIFQQQRHSPEQIPSGQGIHSRSLAFQTLQASNNKRYQHNSSVKKGDAVAIGSQSLDNLDLEVIMAEKKRIAQKRIKQATGDVIIEPLALYRKKYQYKQQPLEQQQLSPKSEKKGESKVQLMRKERQSGFRDHLRTLVSKQMVQAQRPKQVPVTTYELDTMPRQRRSPLMASSSSSSGGESPTNTINRVYERVLSKRKAVEGQNSQNSSELWDDEDLTRIVEESRTLSKPIDSKRSSAVEILSPMYQPQPPETARHQALNYAELANSLERLKAQSRTIDGSKQPFKSTNLSMMLQEARLEMDESSLSKMPKAILSPRALLGPTVGSILESSASISPTQNILGGVLVGSEAHRRSKMKMMQKLAKYTRNMQQKSSQITVERLVEAPIFKVKAINNAKTRQKQKCKSNNIFKASDKPMKRYWEQESILSPISVTRAIISDLRGQLLSKSINNESSQPNSPITGRNMKLGQITTRIANQEMQLTMMPQIQGSPSGSTSNVSHFARYATRIENDRNKNSSGLGRDSKLSKSSDMLRQAQAELNMTLHAQKKKLNFNKALAAVAHYRQKSEQIQAILPPQHHPILQMHENKSRIMERLRPIHIQRGRKFEAIRRVINRTSKEDKEAEETEEEEASSPYNNSDALDETFYLEGCQERNRSTLMGPEYFLNNLPSSGHPSPHLKAGSGMTIAPWRHHGEKINNSCLER